MAPSRRMRKRAILAFATHLDTSAALLHKSAEFGERQLSWPVCRLKQARRGSEVYSHFIQHGAGEMMRPKADNECIARVDNHQQPMTSPLSIQLLNGMTT